MTPTDEDFDRFEAAIRALCDEYGIYMTGTCNREGIFGEITLFPSKEPESHLDRLTHKMNMDHAFNFERERLT